MQMRNHYDSVPRGESGHPHELWWTVEEEPGVAVAGDDYAFNFASKEEAEQAAENLAAQTDSRLTVVEYWRYECATFQRKVIVEREG